MQETQAAGIHSARSKKEDNMGLKALVIGNGESRKSLDISLLKNTHTLIGCNAVHRDLIVDHLICCDQRMVREALENPNTDSTTIYVRNHWHHYFRKIEKNKNVKLLPELPYQSKHRPDNPEHWGSGPYAVLLAASLGFKSIDIVGIDLYGRQGLVNNIYRDTDNYSNSASKAVDPSYWRYQIERVFHYYPDTEFNIINFKEWQCPEEWRKKNVRISTFDVAFTLNISYNSSSAVFHGIQPAL